MRLYLVPARLTCLEREASEFMEIAGLNLEPTASARLVECNLAAAFAVSRAPPTPIPTIDMAPTLLAMARASSTPSAVG